MLQRPNRQYLKEQIDEMVSNKYKTLEKQTDCIGKWREGILEKKNTMFQGKITMLVTIKCISFPYWSPVYSPHYSSQWIIVKGLFRRIRKIAKSDY